MAIITISRGSLSGGEQLAKNLHSKLGYRIVSRESILDAAARYGVDHDELQKGMELPPSMWQRLTRQKDRFILAAKATLAAMIEEGDVIYHGQAGQFLLRDVPNVLKVRLIAPLEHRAKLAAIEKGLTQDEAIKYIHQIDLKRTAWVEKIYGEQWADPSLYDLVVNLSAIDIESAANMIVKLIEGPKFRNSPESETQLRDFCLRTRVTAAIALQSDFPQRTDDFRVSGGTVSVANSVFARENRQRINRFISELPGVTAVVFKGDKEDSSLLEKAENIQTVRDIMLPIDRYPNLREWATIREALVALGASSIKLDDGYLMSPRYVLVTNAAGALVGILSRRDLLRGLSPHASAVEKSLRGLEGMIAVSDFRAGWPSLWSSLFTAAAGRRSRESVQSVMTPIKGTVNVDDDLDTVVETMFDQEVDLVPVTDSGQVVGVVLMTDVFDSVAEGVLETTIDAE
ncbi:MAG: hypothetical protein A2341_19765 [Deltaproteobacteria bacterium RIFOXYB12_FULL_58_9]|nr:MAG: hypothetical protein A2341_19765 [Deltaproteobacteria bacterium RIFOXYB12_FULL_58_9]